MTLFLGMSSVRIYRMFIKILILWPIILSMINGMASAETLELVKAKEELVIVQTVSNDRKSFILSKGIKDGIFKDQEVLFSNESISLLCKAIEVNRQNSLWRPVNKEANIPFNKEEIINYNSHVYGNVSLDIIGDTKKLTPDVNYNIVFKKFRTNNNYSIRASINRGLTQSSSDVSSENNNNRTGYSFSLDYNYRFLPEFEMSSGIRSDKEVYTLKSPQLDIPTNRVLITLAATYHLINFTDNKNNFYLTIAAGIGKSSTTVNGESSSGIATILPEARLGYLVPVSKKIAMVFESSIESLSAREKFSNSADQDTNILNFKLSLGFRF